MDDAGFVALFGLCVTCGAPRKASATVDGHNVTLSLVCSAEPEHREVAVGEMDTRRAPVNGTPYGTVSWAEHEEAWQAYAKRHSGQDAETIARRGGFGMDELIQQLKRLPTSWEPSESTESWWRRW